MKNWNYRVFKQYIEYPDASDTGANGGEWVFSIRETYYERKAYYERKGKIRMHSTNPTSPVSGTLKGLKKTLQLMMDACDKKVLEEDKIVFGKQDKETIK